MIHGLFPKNTEGNIYISYTFDPDKKRINCEIKDDGVGRKIINSPFNKTHDSKGTFLTKQRLVYLSQRYNVDCDIAIIDLHSDSGEPLGTIVTVQLPVFEHQSS